MSNIKIVQIFIKDAEALSEIALKAYRDHYLHFWYDTGDWYMEKCFSVSVLQKEMQDGNAKFFIIYENNEAIGFLKLNIDAALKGEEDKNALELERVYLTKSATGKGAGKKIMEFVFSTAKVKGKELVWLKVMDTSADPITFYKKMGFEICGTFQLDFPAMKKELRGMLVMKRKL